MGSTEILVSGGIAAILAGLAGGGLKAFGVELPLLASVRKQMLFVIVGGGLIGLGLFRAAGADPGSDSRVAAAAAGSPTGGNETARPEASATNGAGGNGPAPPPGAGPVFTPPMLDGRRILGCIRQGQGRQCGRPARRLLAMTFCRRQGYSGAQSWYLTVTPGRRQTYVLVRETQPDGHFRQRFVIDDGGGAAFSTITCQL